jgi:hypothetical protein
MQASLFAGELLRMEEKERPPEEPEAGEARFWAQKKSPWSAEVGGFNVHAGVMIYQPCCNPSMVVRVPDR